MARQNQSLTIVLGRRWGLRQLRSALDLHAPSLRLASGAAPAMATPSRRARDAAAADAQRDAGRAANEAKYTSFLLGCEAGDAGCYARTARA